jgi:Cd2+/Zn2+-exporting ATPase
MVHKYLKKMIHNESRQFYFQLTLFFIGACFLVNSVLAGYLFSLPEIPVMLAFVAALFLGGPIIVNAAVDLWFSRNEMNELVALSILAALCSGEYQVAAVIALFMMISVLLEYRSQLGARKNIESLLRLSPQKAHRLTDDKEDIIDAANLIKGDLIRIRPGDIVPGDGVIKKGQSTLNEAAITGESLPVEKRIGDSVFSGTVNMTGLIDVQIETAGQDTTLSKIKELIHQAEQSKTPVMRMIDQYVSWYTPIILVLAAAVLFFTRDLSRFIAMLVIACPCTILLSSPTAIVAALSAAARLGIIIKDISNLEIANKLSVLVFDKTGTLTTGHLQVTEITGMNGYDDKQLLQDVASFEQHSRHPIAKAIVYKAIAAGLTLEHPENSHETSGMGVKGLLAKAEFVIGRVDWLEQNGIQAADLAAISEKNDCKSVIYVVKDGRLVGWLALTDTLRHDAEKMVHTLKRNGIKRIVMLTGDRKVIAQRVADKLNCDVTAEIFPEDKKRIVEEIKQDGAITGVVGDGVNDAPALAAGDVSIAMGAAGSDVAIHSASIVLLNEDLDRIPFLLHLSHRTVAVMRQNLIFSFCYIVLLLVLAAYGHINPIIAAVLHTASALIVIINSARLVREGEELQ